MRIFYATRSNTVKLCCLSLLIIFVAVVLFTLKGETGDFPSNDEIPASLYGESHGDKQQLSVRIGSVFWSQTWIHCHALAYAHWTRRGFYQVEAYSGRAGSGWFPIIRKHRDKKTAYYRHGCRAIAKIDPVYHVIGPEKLQWIAAYLIWDQTGGRIGQVNREGLGYPFDGDLNLPAGDTGNVGGSNTVRLASTTGYEVTAGNVHEASITTNVPYYSILWGITSPGQTEPDIFAETDQGDGTTTEATLSYTFPANSNPGEYVITAYVFLNDLTKVTESYNVTLTENAGTDDGDGGSDDAGATTPTTYLADSSTRTLTPASGSNTYATVGSTHEASLNSSTPYQSVVWQVRTPSNTGNTVPTVETDTGDGTATDASLSYTFPTGVTGTYTIMAYVWYSDLSARQLSYDVTVTLSPGLRPINSSTYYANGGDTYEMGLVADAPYSQVQWYVKPPGDTSTDGTNVETDTATGTTTEAELSYMLPTSNHGNYQITAHIYRSDGSNYKVTYNVYVY